MVTIMLRKADREIGDSLVAWLDDFGEKDSEVDVYDNKSLLAAVRKLLVKLYPDEVQGLPQH